MIRHEVTGGSVGAQVLTHELSLDAAQWGTLATDAIERSLRRPVGHTSWSGSGFTLAVLSETDALAMLNGAQTKEVGSFGQAGRWVPVGSGRSLRPRHAYLTDAGLIQASGTRDDLVALGLRAWTEPVLVGGTGSRRETRIGSRLRVGLRVQRSVSEVDLLSAAARSREIGPIRADETLADGEVLLVIPSVPAEFAAANMVGPEPVSQAPFAWAVLGRDRATDSGDVLLIRGRFADGFGVTR